MKQKYHIELIEEHDHVNFCSIHLEEEELSVLERFFEMLIDTSRFVTSRIQDGKIMLVDKELIGNLNFTRYENGHSPLHHRYVDSDRRCTG